MKIHNPWLKLHSSDDSYILDIDREDIRRFNASARADEKVMTKSIPDPFIGNIDSARVVLLLLNPGHSELDKKSQKDAEFKKAMFRNLRHESQQYPFYPLNPKFAWTGAGKWWRKCTHKLIEEAGLDYQMLANRLFVIEWFPYHSRKSALRPALVCKSQEYTFQLAKEMLEKNKLVIRMRSKKHWEKVDERFGVVPSLRNPRSGSISRGNTEGDLIERIVEALNGEQ